MAELSKAIARIMEERGAQGQPGSNLDSPQLSTLLQWVSRSLPPDQRELGVSFARLFLAERAGELLGLVEARSLAQVIVDALHFVCRPGDEEPRISVLDSELLDPDDSAGGVVAILMKDRAFIPATVRECFIELGCSVKRLLHPVMAVQRGSHGNVQSITEADALGVSECLVYAEVERVPDHDDLLKLLQERLERLMVVGDDRLAMIRKLRELAEGYDSSALPQPWTAESPEVAALLNWMADGNFVLLGFREYQVSGQASERKAAVRRGTGLGILRSEEKSRWNEAQRLPDLLRRYLNEPPLLMVGRTRSVSPIWRRESMDVIAVKEIDSSGVVCGEKRFIGLFAPELSAAPSEIPVLSEKLRFLLGAAEAEEGLRPSDLTAAFDSLPRTLLFSATVEEIALEVDAILSPDESSEVQVRARLDALGRGVWVTVSLPSTASVQDLYRRVEASLIRSLDAKDVLSRHLVDDGRVNARMHFYLRVPTPRIGPIAIDELKTEITELLLSWEDRLHQGLRDRYSREHAEALTARYLSAFLSEYKALTDPAAAVEDIRYLEELRTSKSTQVSLVNPGDPSSRYTLIRIYLEGEEAVLSEFILMLEHLGLRVVGAELSRLDVVEMEPVHIRSFSVQDDDGEQLDVGKVSPLLTPILRLLYNRRIGSDRLNGLVVSAGLDWHQVDVLRAYAAYCSQVEQTGSRSSLYATLLRWPDVSRSLWDYFDAKFDPLRSAAPKEREEGILQELRERFWQAHRRVISHADSRSLEIMFRVVECTLRTNYFRLSSDSDRGEPNIARQGSVALKFDSRLLPWRREPGLLYESYVYGPRVEALQLRSSEISAGPVFYDDDIESLRSRLIRKAVAADPSLC